MSWSNISATSCSEGTRFEFRPGQKFSGVRFFGVLHDLYSSPNIVWVIKSRIRTAGYVARMGWKEAFIGFWWGNLRERDHWEDPGIHERILGWIFRKWDVEVWTGLAQDRDRWRAIVNVVMNIRVQ
jgi:hypothetical protein